MLPRVFSPMQLIMQQTTVMRRKRINLPLAIDDYEQILGAFPANFNLDFAKLSKLSTDVTAPAVYYRKSFKVKILEYF